MFDRIRDIFSRINFRRNKNISKDNDDDEHGGKIYALWLLVLPLLLGLILGRLASVGMGYALDKLASTAGMSDKAVTGTQEAEKSNEAQRGLDGFLSVNPFHISDRKPEKAPEPAPPEPVEPPAPPSMLDDLVLRGTLPGVGAWIEKAGKLKLMLINDPVERFKLASVTYQDATFKSASDSVVKYITYGPVPTKAKPEAPKPAAAAAPKPAAQPAAPTGNIVAAKPGEQEGQVPSELVNQLVQNPFDELKRIRMRPSDKAGGLEVQWIQNDSILKRLGVQRGDVIKSVNGIPFTNMGDIANSINSLMNSERFDVEVTRGGSPTNLRYVVR